MNGTFRLKHLVGFLAVVIALFVATVPAATTTAAQPAQASVTIDNYAFDPSDLTVAPGTTVVWIDKQLGEPHTTTADDGSWDSGQLQQGDTFAFQFNDVGDFSYSCTVHPDMHGVVRVVPN
jgi:plastocyanin